MKNISQVRLTTKRLRLVPVSMKYAREILKEFTDEITLYMHPKTPETIEDTQKFIRENTRDRKNGREAVTAAKQWIDQHAAYRHIIYDVARDNLSSRKIAESLGGVMKKRFKRTNLNGKTWPYVEYWIKPPR